MTISPFFYKTYLFIRGFIGKVLNFASVLDHVTSGNKSLITHVQKPLRGYKKIAIYTTYKDFHYDIWEKNLIEAIRVSGYELLMVANVNRGKEDAIPKFDFTRRNRGYDIAACRDVLRMLHTVPEELLLINSSTAWGSNARSVIEKAQNLSRAEQCEIVFAIQSFQPEEHGQSFFIYSEGHGVNALMETLESAKNWKTKRATVYFGEILLLRKLQKKAIKVGYLFKYNELVRNYCFDPTIRSKTNAKILIGFPVNPAHDFWKVLITLDSQFIKRNLFNTKKNKFDSFPVSIDQAFKDA